MTIIVLTGAPGVGKTTAVMRAARALNDRGLNVGDIVSRELRTNNMRIGFEFIDLITNDTNVLASITGKDVHGIPNIPGGVPGIPNIHGGPPNNSGFPSNIFGP